MNDWTDYEIEREHQIRFVQSLLSDEFKEPPVNFREMAIRIVDGLLSQFIEKGEKNNE